MPCSGVPHWRRLGAVDHHGMMLPHFVCACELLTSGAERGLDVDRDLSVDGNFGYGLAVSCRGRYPEDDQSDDGGDSRLPRRWPHDGDAAAVLGGGSG